MQRPGRLKASQLSLRRPLLAIACFSAIPLTSCIALSEYRPKENAEISEAPNLAQAEGQGSSAELIQRSTNRETLMFVPGRNGAVTAVPVYLGGEVSSGSRGKSIAPGRTSTDRWEVLAAQLRERKSILDPTKFKIYPSAVVGCEFPKKKSLAYMFRFYIRGSLVALPVQCIVPDRIDELSFLATAGNMNARVVMLSLALEIEYGDWKLNLSDLLKLSDEGSGPASISTGNYFKLIGDRVRSAERYELAGHQGITNASLYERSINTVILPMPLR